MERMVTIPVCAGRGLALRDTFSGWSVKNDEIKLYRSRTEPRVGMLVLLRGEDDCLLPGICYQGDDFAQVAVCFEIRHPETGEWARVDMTSLPHSIPELERNRASSCGGIELKFLGQN